MQLNHVVDTKDVMYYSIGRGVTRRAPSVNSIEGAQFVVRQSSEPKSCGLDNMTARQPQLNCQLLVTNVHENTNEIFSVYPLPIQDLCTIEFQLERSALVTVEIFDALGKKIAEPIHQNYSAGNYRQTMNLKDVPPAVYVCKLQIGHRIMSKTLVKLIDIVFYRSDFGFDCLENKLDTIMKRNNTKKILIVSC